MKLSDIIVMVWGVGFITFAAWHMWKNVFKPARDRRKILGAEDDTLLQKIGENLSLLHDVFGPQFQIRTYDEKAGRSIALVCPKCEKPNRLVRGFRGARCGNCKTSFVPKEMRTSAEKEVRLN